MNRGCKISGIVIILAMTMAFWFFYNKIIRKSNGDSFEGTLFNFPNSIKCLFPNVSYKEHKNICEDADFDGWSVLHVILYVLMGALFPNEYVLVLILSIFSEMWEYVSGWGARWIVDPLVNLSSYWVGSQISKKYDLDICKRYKIPGRYTFIGLVMLSIFMILNNPDFIGLKE